MSHREQDAYSGSLLEEFRERVGVDKWGRTPVQAAKDRGQKYHMQETTVQIGAGGRLHLLEARLEAIERGCYYYRGLDPESVAQNTRIAYYEGQIEEISGKWQAAAEYANMCADRCAILEKRNDEGVDTIADLREKLAEKTEAFDSMARVKMVSTSRDEYMNNQAKLRNTEQKVSQLEAILAEKNRELEVKYSYHSQVMSDAKLGVLVRKMPEGDEISHLTQWYYGPANRLDLKRSGLTPEAAIAEYRKERE